MPTPLLAATAPPTYPPPLFTLLICPATLTVSITVRWRWFAVGAKGNGSRFLGVVGVKPAEARMGASPPGDVSREGMLMVLILDADAAGLVLGGVVEEHKELRAL